VGIQLNRFAFCSLARSCVCFSIRSQINKIGLRIIAYMATASSTATIISQFIINIWPTNSNYPSKQNLYDSVF